MRLGRLREKDAKCDLRVLQQDKPCRQSVELTVQYAQFVILSAQSHLISF